MASAFDPSAITECDREPIHIPGAIQPHGLLLVVDAAGQVIGGAGDIETRLAAEWRGRNLAELIGEPEVAALLAGDMVTNLRGRDETFTATAHRVAPYLLVELEPVSAASLPAPLLLSRLSRAGDALGQTSSLREVCERAATAFRTLTGFDRVMIYRFLDDGTGVVMAEAAAPGLGSFLNHHFPASDVPKQARALYIRNRVRVIPDVGYTPAPLRSAATSLRELDLSDAALRSVSPIHVQYLRNMGVAASASVSIVKDELLWGLVACHNATPRQLPYDIRLACEALAGGLARQVRAKDEAEYYRERIRLRASEDIVLARLGPERSLDSLLSTAGEELVHMMRAGGFAAVRGGEMLRVGTTPDPAGLAALADWLDARTLAQPFATDALPAAFPPAEAFQAIGSGVLAARVAGDVPIFLMWFRPETLEEVKWAGDPHKDTALAPGEMLTPRASFESWGQQVRGRSRAWALGDVESAGRLARSIFDLRQFHRVQALNQELQASNAENEQLLRQKDLLMREVGHRVQNSLQLVSAFLAMQGRGADEPGVRAQLDEARNRISAVALVHRRLYADERVETVDLGRYLEDLVAELKSSMDDAWRAHITLDAAPVLISADRAVHVGLVLTELVINANKYAYGGAAGPISIGLEQHRASFRLIVADHGKGRTDARSGFGSRMLAAMVERLGGTLQETDNNPGLRIILAAPIVS